VTETSPLTIELLDELARRWRALDAPIAQQLEPGLNDEAIDALVEPLGLRVPLEARTLWKWHNGARDAFIVTTGGKAFSALETCVELASQMRDIARDVARPYRLSASEADDMARSVWNWDWLPLAYDGVSGKLVIDAARDATPRDVCPVLYRANDDGSKAAVVAPSIGSLVRQWIAVLDAAEPYDHDHDRWIFDPEKLSREYDDRLV
jgi:cell wall assembly regulator SMI1